MYFDSSDDIYSYTYT